MGRTLSGGVESSAIKEKEKGERERSGEKVADFFFWIYAVVQTEACYINIELQFGG